MTTIAVHGASGVQGGAMARAFSAAGDTVRALTRNPADLTSQPNPYFADLSDLDSLRAAYNGQTWLALHIPFFVQPPNNPMTYLQNVLTAAKDASVEQILWNPGGYLPDEPWDRPEIDFRYHMFHMIKDSGIAYTVVAPGAYMENLAGPWTAALVREQNELTYPIRDGDCIGWITANDVGAILAAMAGKPAYVNTLHAVNGPHNLSGPEMAAQFSEALGRQITFRALTPDAFGAQLGAVLGEEAGKGIAANYHFVQSHWEKLMPYRDMTPLTEALGMELTPLSTWVRHAAGAFGG